MRKLIAGLVILLFFSCQNQDLVYKQKVTLPDGRWTYDNSVEFNFEISDTVQRYDLILEVTHDREYEFENIYVLIHTVFPSGSEATDELSLEIADDLDQWEGKCRGIDCTVEIQLQENIFFKETGTHTLKIEQYNRVNPLSGIKALEMRIVKAPGSSAR